MGHLRRRIRVLLVWLALPAAGLAFAVPSHPAPPRASGNADDRARLDRGISGTARLAPGAAEVAPPGHARMHAEAASGVPAPMGLAAVLPGFWTKAPPPIRYGGLAVYDSTRDRMLLLSGSPYSREEDTWTLPLAQEGAWTPSPRTPGSPPPVENALGVMDPRHNRFILYGGGLSPNRSPLAFVLDLDPTPRWHVVYTKTEGLYAPGREQCAGAYDTTRDRLLIFGGFGDRGVLGDLWELTLGDSADWKELHPAGEAPAGRWDASAVYDPVGDRFLLLGGEVLVAPNSADANAELWQLSLRDSLVWTRLDPVGDLPGPIAGQHAEWDVASATMLVFGGYRPEGSADDVYQYDPVTNAWTRLASPGGPRRANGRSPIAYDRSRDRYLFYGSGDNAPNDVDVESWTLRPSPAWTLLPGLALPSGRFGQATIHDTQRDRMLVFGGVSADGYLADPWWASLADPFSWSPLTTQGAAPPSRHEPVGVYDPRRDQAVFFGGWTYQSNYMNDTWALSLSEPPTWTAVTPAGVAPAPRRGHAAVYDPQRDRMLVYGGLDDSLVFGDLWALNLGSPMWWERLEPAGTLPPPRFFASLAYDPGRDRVLLYGGRGEEPRSLEDTWELSLADLRWSKVEFEGPAPSLERHMASYDAERDRMLVHGGWNVDYDLIMSIAASYALVSRPTPHWEYVRSTGANPGTRIAHSQVFDPLRDRMAVFAGGGFFSFTNDRMLLAFSSEATRHAWVVTSSTLPGSARIVWQTVDVPGAAWLVERKEDGGDWQPVSAVSPDAQSRVLFDDTGLRRGWRYGYRLRITSALGIELAGMVTVDIPGATGIDLAGGRPNPARASEVALWFSLPVPGDAHVTLYDLHGRVAWDRALPAAPPGPQVVQPDVRLRAGIYFARVSQAGRQSTRKLTVLP